MDILNNLYNEKNAEQVIDVRPNTDDSFEAELECYERKDDQWIKVFDLMSAKIGKNGVTENKAEGDMKSPLGVYSFSMFFGSVDNIGFKFPYKKVDGNQFWVDDAESEYYNTWQEGSSDGRWKSAENLLHPAYKYAAVIDYNTKRIKGKGSAIFFHKINKGGTEGCIALCEEDLIKVLMWLDPNKNPLIIVNRSND